MSIALQPHAPSLWSQRGRLRFRDEHRAGMPLERHQRIACQFRTTSVISDSEVEDLARARCRPRWCRQLRLLPYRARSGGDDVPGEELDRHAVHAHVELLLVARLVAFPQIFYVRSRKTPIRQRDDDFM